MLNLLTEASTTFDPTTVFSNLDTTQMIPVLVAGIGAVSGIVITAIAVKGGFNFVIGKIKSVFGR